jgi:peptide deformylase
MPLPIAQLGQPVLREKSVDVSADEIHTPEFQQFLRDMQETMVTAGGIGLAAPQVFAGKRVFLAGILPPENPDDEDARPGTEVFVNPRIVAASEPRVNGWEGCLSFIELQVLVSRHVWVVVDYLTSTGEPRRIELSGFPARVVQHEYDHIEGVLTIDRAASTRDIVKASEMETVLKSRTTTPET